MKKFLFISCIYFLCLHASWAQPRYAGYILHEREQSANSGYSVFIHSLRIIVPYGQDLPDSIKNGAIGDYAHKTKQTILKDGNVLIEYIYKQRAVLHSSSFRPSLTIEPLIHLNGSDSLIVIDCATHKVQPYSEGHIFDTSMLVNLDYPLITRKGQVFRFNAFNRHPQAFSSSQSMTVENREKEREKGIYSDYYTSEMLFYPKDTGYYFLTTWISMIGGPFYQTSAFSTIYVSPDTSLPTGYFIFNNKSYKDTFLVINPRLQNNSVNFKYLYINADSIKFSLLPGDRSNIGYHLQYSLNSVNSYNINLSWDELSYFGNLMDNKSFINLLITKYKEGKEYFETLTVSADNNYNVSVNQKEKNQAINIFPNPTNGRFTLQTSIIGLNYEITDLFGRYLAVGKCNQEYTNIDISSYPKGIYYIQVINTQNDLVKSVKLVKY